MTVAPAEPAPLPPPAEAPAIGPALAVRSLGKSFLVPRARRPKGEPPADPRRESAGRTRDRLHALRDVSFEARRGETVAIVGANGSGKSTLLKILAGVSQPDSGSFVADGRVGALLEVGAGFHPELTGADNLRLAGALVGMSGREIDRCVHDIVGFAELERFMDMPVKHYSSGMVVRLGFAAAIRMHPDILLLDETFAVGDARFQHRALGRIRELQAAGTTIVLASHSSGLVLELASRVVWLEGGRVAMDGEPRRVLAAYLRGAPAGRFGEDPMDARLALRGEFEIEGAGDGLRIAGVRVAGETRLESGDPLRVEVRFRPPAEGRTDAPDAVLDLVFVRDDGVPVARAVAAAAAERIARGEALTLDFDPIRLAMGEYTIVATLSETDAGGAPGARRAIHRVEEPRAFRVVTPLPRDFRVAARIEGEWVAEAGDGA